MSYATPADLPSEYLSTLEAGRELGMNGDAVYKLIFDSELPYRRFRNFPFVRIHREAVEEYRRTHLSAEQPST